MLELSALALSAMLVVTACGSKTQPPPPTEVQATSPDPTTATTATTAPAATTATTAPPAVPAPLTPPPKPWHDLSDDEKKAHMKDVIMPAMKQRFQAFDGEEFAKFTCATCHGANARDVKFEMPNPELTKLPETREGFEKLAQTKQKALDFMGQVVMPDMATMLGEPPFDPATNKGFSCYNCHTKQ